MKNNKKPDTGDNIKMIKIQTSLTVLILTLVITVLCFSASTYAWFTMNVQSIENKISAASFSIDVLSITDSENNAVSAENGQYNLKKDVRYYVTIKGSGNTKGYCTVSHGEVNQYTQAFQPDEQITFSIVPDMYVAYSFIANWGNPSKIDFNNVSGSNTLNFNESSSLSGANDKIPSNTDIQQNSLSEKISSDGGENQENSSSDLD